MSKALRNDGDRVVTRLELEYVLNRYHRMTHPTLGDRMRSAWAALRRAPEKFLASLPHIPVMA